MRYGLVIIAFLGVLAAHAQDERSLREVAVSGQRRLSDTGLQRTQLDTAVLHQDVALSMSDILTQHSPLFIKSYGRATESTAEFRGTSPSHTQVLWNGLKINSAMLGTVDFSMIPAYFVDEATLLHGASSLTSTGGGLGGAVLLQTRPENEEGLGLHYVQGYGSFETFDQFLRLTLGGERWHSSTRVSYATSKNNFPYTNHDKKIDERDAAGNIIRSYHPTERNRSGYFDDINALQELYYHDDSGNRFGLQAWYTHSLRGLPFLSVDYRDDSDFKNEHQQDVVRSVLSWDRALEHASFSAKGGYIYQHIAYDYSMSHGGIDTDITHSRSQSQQGFLQGEATLMPHPQWMLTATAALRYNHVSSSDKSPFHIGDNYREGRVESELSLSAKYRPTPRLTFAALLREESYRRDFIPLIPALFADYALVTMPHTSLVLKASVARNYRYPTMDDLYFQPGGNPNLQPERGFTYDGGLEWALQRKQFSLKTNLSAFDSYIDDWILWTPNAKGYWQPANLKRVHNYGVELSANATWQLPQDWQLDLTGNYAYTPSLNQSDDLAVADASYGKQLVYVPLHSANVSASAKWRSWGLTYQWHCYSERYTTTSNEVQYITGRLKPYYMNNVMLERQLLLGKTRGALKFAVYNLLDTEYVTVLSRPMAGRHFEIFLEIKPRW